jgi:hypothetical protein
MLTESSAVLHLLWGVPSLRVSTIAAISLNQSRLASQLLSGNPLDKSTANLDAIHAQVASRQRHWPPLLACVSTRHRHPEGDGASCLHSASEVVGQAACWHTWPEAHCRTASAWPGVRLSHGEQTDARTTRRCSLGLGCWFVLSSLMPPLSPASTGVDHSKLQAG